MRRKLVLSMIIAALVIVFTSALAQASTAAEQRIIQPITVNGQSAQGVLVVENGAVLTVSCDSPVPYVTANQSESGWACFEQATGMWLLHAQPTAQQSSTVYNSPSTVYVPTYSSYYPYYSYGYPYYSYPYSYYGYPYYWGVPFGIGFGVNFGHGFHGHDIHVSRGFVHGGFNRGSVGFVRTAPGFGHGSVGVVHSGGGFVRGGGGFVRGGGGFARGGGGFAHGGGGFAHGGGFGHGGGMGGHFGGGGRR